MTIYTSYTDQELLDKLCSSDRLAFDTLYERHWDKVYNQSFKKLHNPELAKDITQEVFIYLWSNREQNNINNLSAYLFTAVRNNVFRALQKESKFIELTDLILEARAYYPGADAGLLEKEFFKTYDSLVSAMPPAQQKIFRMRYDDGLSTQEIADILKLSRGTVQNQLTRAVSMLRASLLSIAMIISQQ